jgi:hypothetical protein
MFEQFFGSNFFGGRGSRSASFSFGGGPGASFSGAGSDGQGGFGYGGGNFGFGAGGTRQTKQQPPKELYVGNSDILQVTASAFNQRNKTDIWLIHFYKPSKEFL